MHRDKFVRPAPLAIVLVAVVFAVDLLLPLGVAAAVPYTFAVLLALSAKPRWFGPVVAVLCCILTLAKMGLVPERGTTEMWKVIVNRCLAIFAIGMTTLLGLLRRNAELRIRQHEADLVRMGRVAVAGELSTVLAHELNQPLAAICLQADVASHLARDSASPELQLALHEISEQSRRAGEIVRSMRQAVRRTEPERGSVNLNMVVATVVRLLDWKSRRNAVTVQTQLAENLPQTHGDRIQLEQVVFNLLQNAIEAVTSQPDGQRTVEIETTIASRMLTVRVRDTGLGVIDTERIFERFYTTKPEGMGLGLAISRSIAESHGGRLRASATKPGAEFVLELPADDEEHVI